jgi:L-serine dehydratase
MSALIGVFDLFRIGLGPSSSHTVGPMLAAGRFVRDAADLAGRAASITVTLYGSLAWTGKGHGTDTAVLAGLAGMDPATAEPDAVHALPARIGATGTLDVAGLGPLPFDLDRDIVFDRLTRMPGHPNTLRLALADAQGTSLREEVWHSVGGGFIVRAGDGPASVAQAALPHDVTTARDLLAEAALHGLSIAELQFANECAVRPPAAVRAHLAAVAAAMARCIDRGLAAEGALPGGLNVRRRAARLADRLAEARRCNQRAPSDATDHASLWAIAVNEENAAGGRVVTAPTNGAAGVLPSVLRYWQTYYPETSTAGIATAGLAGSEAFLLAAAAVGALAKRNASISGAEVGCQGEVGVACAMAAAGLASALGGTPAQVENAAEIGLEHHLGMTCDPIGGLVQIPCIERNAMGAVKAISAATLALSGDGTHRVSLDEAIATMRQTGLDMHSKYKETAQGGLAVHVPEC